MNVEALIARTLGNTVTRLPQINPWAPKHREPERTNVKRVLALPPPPEVSAPTPKPTMLQTVCTLSDVVLPRPTATRVVKAASEITGIGIVDIMSSSRPLHIVRARHIAAYAIRVLTGKSLPEIGRVLNRDHSTICHALKCVEAKRKYYEPELSQVISRFSQIGYPQFE